jgi:hypothetical protein
MADTLPKALEEKKHLEEDLRALEDAIPSKQACASLVEYIQKTPEPLVDPENIWVKNGPGGCGCSIS